MELHAPIPRVTLGILLGLAAGLVDVLLTLPMTFPDKRTALTAAFLSRFAIGSLAANVNLPVPPAMAGCPALLRLPRRPQAPRPLPRGDQENLHPPGPEVRLAGVHPRKASIILTVKAAKPITGARVAKSDQVSAGRWHIDIKLTATGDIDAQLLAWLREACPLLVGD